MFTSKNNVARRKLLVTGIADVGAAFLCWAFSAIYIACGHGKTSGAMVCLLVPFFLSGMLMIILSFTRLYERVNIAARCLWNFSMASVTVGMALVGIFEIAGVPKSSFLIPIFAGGAIFALCSIAIVIFNKKKSLEEI